MFSLAIGPSRSIIITLMDGYELVHPCIKEYPIKLCVHNCSVWKNNLNRSAYNLTSIAFQALRAVYHPGVQGRPTML